MPTGRNLSNISEAIYQEAIAKMSCEKCGARPGEDCFTPNGRKWKDKAHIERVQALERSKGAEKPQAETR